MVERWADLGFVNRPVDDWLSSLSIVPLYFVWHLSLDLIICFTPTATHGTHGIWQERHQLFPSWFRFSLPYLVVDAGERCVISDGLEGRPSPVAIRGRCHFPAELHRCLVDASLAAAILHDGIPREVGVTGSDTDQWVAGRRGFLDAFLWNLFHMIIVSKGDDLEESSRASGWVEEHKGQGTMVAFRDHTTSSLLGIL